MNYPAGFSHRIYKTRLSGIISFPKKIDEILKNNPGSEIDILYEKLKPIVVIVFETQEDCLAFTLKYGTNYV